MRPRSRRPRSRRTWADGLGGFHWIWPNYLFAYGGRFFADPPRDARRRCSRPPSQSNPRRSSAGCAWEFSVPGVQRLRGAAVVGGDDGGAAPPYRIDALAWVGPGRGPGQSAGQGPEWGSRYRRVARQRFPQAAVHGLQIPAGARQKDVSWEFIKWATSKEVMGRISESVVYPAVTRASVLGGPRAARSTTGVARISALCTGPFSSRRAPGTWRTGPCPSFPIGDRVSIALSADLHRAEARRPGDARRPGATSRGFSRRQVAPSGSPRLRRPDGQCGGGACLPWSCSRRPCSCWPW